MSYTGLYQKSSTYDTCNCSFTHCIHLEAYIFLFIYWYSYINTFKPTFRALELSTGLANTTFAPKEGHLCSRQRTISKGQGGLGGVVNIQDIYFYITFIYHTITRAPSRWHKLRLTKIPPVPSCRGHSGDPHKNLQDRTYTQTQQRWPSIIWTKVLLLCTNTVGGRTIQTLTYIHNPHPPEFQCYWCPLSMVANGRNKSNPWRLTWRHKTVTLKFRGAGGTYSSRICGLINLSIYCNYSTY